VSILLKVSIIIPVYNEGDHLAACLSAIAEQTVAPHEVIVIDNNSTDNSRHVAARFPFVTLITEKKQGVVHARDAGFNLASGDIIGRIDADTMIEPGWIATVQKLFEGSALDAVSGAVSYHDLPWKRFLASLDLGFRQWIANGMGDQAFLYGSNMAVRRRSWNQVRSDVCRTGGLHEDFDLAIHLASHKQTVRFDRRLRAAVSLRRFNVSLSNYWQYVWLSPKTYSLHGRHNQRRMYPVVTLVVSCYFIIQLLYRSYDPETDTISFSNFFLQRSPLRVDPTAFVD
jgi:glycosyltransferase involved in cell wall biosynthesis